MQNTSGPRLLSKVVNNVEVKVSYHFCLRTLIEMVNIVFLNFYLAYLLRDINGSIGCKGTP